MQAGELCDLCHTLLQPPVGEIGTTLLEETSRTGYPAWSDLVPLWLRTPVVYFCADKLN